ncbi:MAG: RNA ligase (ATP) [Prochloraceae cyanobacterium]
MAEFRVIKAKVKVFPHPNAERLELLKIGTFQAVVEKGVYRDGDAVIFAPERSILPEKLAEDYRKYLRGAEKNRVGTIRLRGQLSMGVIIPLKRIDSKDLFPYDEDISEQLGIIKYEPPIPQSLAGEVKPILDFSYVTKHDVEQFRIYADNFIPKEPVLVTEKIHGSQVVYFRNKNGEIAVSSKGMLRRGLTLKESADNFYWTAGYNLNIFETLASLFPNNDVQIFGEVVPIQKGFNYGFDRPWALFYKLVVDGRIVPYQEVPEEIKINWIPILYQGEYDEYKIVKLCEKIKYETVSGKKLHISEGGVITPIAPRYSSEGFDLQLKIISKAYAKIEDDEAIS